ncbi:hypothetical protein ANCCAN_08897 [Ancylostoma caninum]|uniref:Rad60/SUMO-like domain-containing protein n=1 Tax=Ancylostoma caninum TaxID=29170 RepID=A0A368GQ92_ANCCA|nr:hypothetical protein ANCCAN_08897 [Ancylostoma caninum]
MAYFIENVADNGSEAPAAGDAGVEYIKLKVVVQDSNVVHFRVKNVTAMGKLRKFYADCTGVAISSLRRYDEVSAHVGEGDSCARFGMSFIILADIIHIV